MQKFAIGVVFLFLLPLAAMAQDTPKAEVFGGYSYLRANVLPRVGIDLNLNGWNGSVSGNVNDWLGVTADFSGQYGRPSFLGFSPEGLKTNVHSFLFGPSVAYRGNSALVPFGHALFGVSRGYANLFGFNVSDSAFAMAFGGGVDLKLGDAIAVRLIQADYMQTRFAFGHQDHTRLSAGIVFRLGRE